jgi:hypothetical protein
MSVGQQAGGSDRRAVFVCERMDAVRVVLIHFELRRHVLLFHEHGKSNALRFSFGFLPRHERDLQHGAKSIITL